MEAIFGSVDIDLMVTLTSDVTDLRADYILFGGRSQSNTKLPVRMRNNKVSNCDPIALTLYIPCPIIDLKPVRHTHPHFGGLYSLTFPGLPQKEDINFNFIFLHHLAYSQSCVTTSSGLHGPIVELIQN